MILYEKERSGETRYLYHQNDTNLSFQVHNHDSYEAILVLEGELLCDVEGHPYDLKRGQGLLIQPGQIHAYATQERSKSYLCIFSKDFISPFDLTTKGQHLVRPVFDCPDGERVRDVLQSGRNIFLKQAELYRICGAALEGGLAPVEEKSFNLRGRLVSYVQEHYREDISLRTFAKNEGYNYCYLSAFFNRNFNMNFSAYVNRFRLQYAAHLLLTTKRSISQIVSDCGFSSLRNMNIAFKNQYGLSPTAYRKTGADA